MKEIIIGLICVMASNILLGASLSKFKEEFSKEVLFKGIFKAICICLGVSLVYLCGYLNPNILAVNIEGVSVNLVDALRILFTGGIMYYGCQCILKIKDILKVDTTVDEIELTSEMLDEFTNNKGDEDE